MKCMKYPKSIIIGSLLVLCTGATAVAAESVTPACPDIVISRNLTVGSRDASTGKDVSRLQVFLGISPTGYFGPITKAGVITFQKENSIVPAVGYVGPLTRAAIVKRCSGGVSTTNVSFSPAPTTGTAPLAVTFSVSGSGLGRGQYIIAYGDGANSGPLQSYCTTTANATSSCEFSAGHTYASAGVYSATLEPYVACMWGTPRCMLYTQLLGTATITVGKVATASTLTIPGSVTLAPGASASASGTYSTNTLTVNTVSVGTASASLTWSESHCGTSGCLGAPDPAPQTITLKLSGTSGYTSALGYKLTLTAVGANSATVNVTK